jgi:hypothetical protein
MSKILELFELFGMKKFIFYVFVDNVKEFFCPQGTVSFRKKKVQKMKNTYLKT